MSLKQQIQNDMKGALRARDSIRLSTLRLLIAAIQQRELDERIELDDAGTLGIVEKLIKQRRESARQFLEAGREDRAQAEQTEAEILTAYLPAALDEAELEAQIKAAIRESGASAPADMGKVMGLLKSRLAGRADLSEVSRCVRAQLAR